MPFSTTNSCLMPFNRTRFILGSLLAGSMVAPTQAQWNAPGNYSVQDQFDLTVEDVSKAGDIVGTAWCNAPLCGASDGTAIVMIKSCDGELIPYWMDSRHQALDSDRNMYGSLMVAGVEIGANPSLSAPSLWHFDRTEGAVTAVKVDLSGYFEPAVDTYFSSVTSDDENQRWIIIGRAKNIGGMSAGPVTVSVPYPSSGEPNPSSLIVFGPNTDPADDQATGCGTQDAIIGTLRDVWDIQAYEGGQANVFGVAGAASAQDTDGDETIISVLGSSDVVGPGNDLLMPNAADYLVTPNDWVCYEEATDNEFSEYSTQALYAFDTLADGSVAGGMYAYLEDGTSVVRGWSSPAGADSVAQRYDPISGDDASSVAIRASLVEVNELLELRVVGMSQESADMCDYSITNPTRVASSQLMYSMRLTCYKNDRAVEWSGNNPTPFDLNDRISGDEITLVSATGINRSHDIVGMAYAQSVGYFGFLLTADDTLVNLDELATQVVEPCAGDVNGDARVDGVDLGAMLAAWGAYEGECRTEDLNCDGTVDGADFGTLLASWGCNQCLHISE